MIFWSKCRRWESTTQKQKAQELSYHVKDALKVLFWRYLQLRKQDKKDSTLEINLDNFIREMV
jgi:hypothetical protein